MSAESNGTKRKVPEALEGLGDGITKGSGLPGSESRKRQVSPIVVDVVGFASGVEALSAKDPEVVE